MNSASQAPISDLVPQSRQIPAGYSSAAHRATVLTSWKEIAQYMGKGVRTVQRWEQDFGLPVRRPYGSNKKAILARPQDLDMWIAMRCKSRASMEMLGLQPGEVPGNGMGRLPGKLCALNASMETHLKLREANLALLCDLKEAVVKLQSSILGLTQ